MHCSHKSVAGLSQMAQRVGQSVSKVKSFTCSNMASLLFWIEMPARLWGYFAGTCVRECSHAYLARLTLLCFPKKVPRNAEYILLFLTQEDETLAYTWCVVLPYVLTLTGFSVLVLLKCLCSDKLQKCFFRVCSCENCKVQLSIPWQARSKGST